MSESVQVYLRVRPLTADETEKGLMSLCEINDDGKSITVYPPDASEMHAAVAECLREKAAFDNEAESVRTPSRRGACATPGTRSRAKSPAPYVCDVEMACVVPVGPWRYRGTRG